jgi:Rrf2 family iron-sulfur cluster assembly transcriptional regulator
MRMTTRGLYGLRAILTLAELSDEQKPVSLQRIAQIEGLAPEFLQQLFYKLRKAGIVKAFRGPGGGFSLNKKLNEISTYDILFAVGETLEIVPCSIEKNRRKICPNCNFCDAGDFWIGMERTIVEYAKSTYLSDFLHRARALLKQA